MLSPYSTKLNWSRQAGKSAHVLWKSEAWAGENAVYTSAYVDMYVYVCEGI